MAPPRGHPPLSLLFLLLLFLRTSAAAFTGALPGCPDKCGDVPVPYPFGLQDDCYMTPGFRMTCNASYSPPRLSVSVTNLPATDISADAVLVETLIAKNCYAPLNLGPDVDSISLNVEGLPYTISSSRNRFTAVGCDTVAINYRSLALDYTSGCLAFCTDRNSITNGTCSGIGCCQTGVPRGLKRLLTLLRPLRNHTQTWRISPCIYAFVVDQDRFTFDVGELDVLYKRRTVPTVLDWAVGDAPCEEAVRSDTYACRANSFCVNSTNGPGYRCSCRSGFTGNPYLSNGCQDIDECADPATNPCVGICTNTAGSYACSCPKGYSGDGKKEGKGCIKKSSRFPLVQVVLGVGLGTLFLIVACSWLYWAFKKRRMILLREKLFKQNGGLLLEQQIASREGSTRETARIFTAEELKKATDSFSKSRIIGSGGYGNVYRGVLPDGQVVAIKKSKQQQAADEFQVEQFINEVVVLSRVVHRNVVRIIGCCLETEVPLLVYEFVSNGTLSSHIHNDGGRGGNQPTGSSWQGGLPWDARLRVAAETAGALAYLHSDASPRPIVHRDVKSSNILLDAGLVTKVADFGTSRLIPLGRNMVTTLVQGTMGYLDPEYLQNGHLTEKSDVYSFGVVLAEMLTGRRPLMESTLARFFLRAVKEDRVLEVVDARVGREAGREQVVGVARVAERCLSVKGEERPSMKEVAAELERLRAPQHHQGRHQEQQQQPQQQQQVGRVNGDSSDVYNTATFHSADVFHTAAFQADENGTDVFHTARFHAGDET